MLENVGLLAKICNKNRGFAVVKWRICPNELDLVLAKFLNVLGHWEAWYLSFACELPEFEFSAARASSYCPQLCV